MIAPSPRPSLAGWFLPRGAWMLTLVLAGFAAASASAVTVPLGNLFDDDTSTSLNSAIATDTYQAQGAVGDLGVYTVIDGGLNSAQSIAPGVSFNLGGNAGGANNAIGGGPGNDTYRSSVNVPIRTTAVAGGLGTTKIEDGIGMHADELITFDLGQLRSAGKLSTFASYFTARAGINDSAHPGGNANAVVIVSDAAGNVLAGYLNGERVGVTENAGVWTFDAAPTKGLSGGSVASRVAPLAVPLAANAAYLTLAATSKGDSVSDHVVFSEAQWDSHAVPLGNLFGDGPGTSLASAIASDPRGAAPNASDRYIDKVQAGNLNGNVVIAGAGTSQITFAMNTVGGGASGAGLPGNDTRRSGATELTLQTRGYDAQALPTTSVFEDGIGIHANALVTFDLDEIRLGGGLHPDQSFTFQARAGLSDSASPNGALRSVVIVSDDAGNVLAAYVNGLLQSINLSGGIWSIAGAIPGEVTAAGNLFHDYYVPLGGNAAFLTLAATSGDINSDHAAFSGARLTFTPVPEPSTLALLTLGGLAALGMAARKRNR